MKLELIIYLNSRGYLTSQEALDAIRGSIPLDLETSKNDTFLSVKKKRFACQCGVYIFRETKKYKHVYICNGCQQVFWRGG